MDRVKQAEYFEFLEELRESGAINMYGAGPYLSEESYISPSEAREILKAWMDSYSEEDE